MSVQLKQTVSIMENDILGGGQHLTTLFPGMIGEPYVSMIVQQLPHWEHCLEFNVDARDHQKA